MSQETHNPAHRFVKSSSAGPTDTEAMALWKATGRKSIGLKAFVFCPTSLKPLYSLLWEELDVCMYE